MKKLRLVIVIEDEGDPELPWQIRLRHVLKRLLRTWRWKAVALRYDWQVTLLGDEEVFFHGVNTGRHGAQSNSDGAGGGGGGGPGVDAGADPIGG